MLPFGMRKLVKAVFDPIVSCLFTTGRTETGFAGVRYFNAIVAFGTEKSMITKVLCAAYKKFKHINNDSVSD